MKKLILAIMVIVVTGAFEQRAAIVIHKRKPSAAAEVISGLDSLGSKIDQLNIKNAQVSLHEK